MTQVGFQVMCVVWGVFLRVGWIFLGLWVFDFVGLFGGWIDFVFVS